ncbi:hypothetical protein [Microtetraspora malaysiensis]|uniref:hypothetical protein n=1 Tax=Microtetraspora malaysiensis TaxID=161358 RepID=UPI003D92BB32
MPSVLVVGFDPRAMPGVDADAINTALDKELARFGELGVDSAVTLVVSDDSAEPTLVASLTERPWDVVVVGGGIRKTEQLLLLFEQIVNLVHRHAPQAAIAFNAGVADTVEAALRRL